MDVAVILPHTSIDIRSLEGVLRALAAYNIEPDLVTSDGRSLQGDDLDLVADARFSEIRPRGYDCYVVIGCRGGRHRFDDDATASFIADVVQAEIPLLAVCDAVGMLAEEGLLEGCEVAACHTDMLRVEERVGSVVDAAYARCGQVFTVCGETDVAGAVDALLDAVPEKG